jgi:hypothetical protein
MTLAISLLGTAFLSGATVAVIALIVVGIRRDDRAKNLTSDPRTQLEAATRRMLGVGVRNGDPHEDGEE